MGNTTVSLKTETRDRLKKYGFKGETWDQILNYLMDEADKVQTMCDKIKELEEECNTLNMATSDMARELQGKSEY